MCISTRLTCADEVAALPNDRNIPSTAMILTNPLILICSPLLDQTIRAALPQKSESTVGSMSVPPAVAGGSTVEVQINRNTAFLITDPPATAGGTDIYPSAMPDF